MSDQEFPDVLAWRPDDEKADGYHENPVEGVLKDVSMFTGGTYADYPIATIELDDGKLIAIHAFRKTIREALINSAPKYGDRLKVWFGGIKEGKSGGPDWYLYKLVVVGREGSFNWAKLDPNAPEDDGHVIYDKQTVSAASEPAEDDAGVEFLQ